MSDFEYASVVVSIVLALGIADILRFLADTFRESGGRRIYWVHLLWIIILFELHVEFWWRMWSFKDLVTIGPSLGLVLLGPAMLFVTTRALLPVAASDADMQALYYRRKTLFFIMLALLNLWALALSPWGVAEVPEEGAAIALSLFAFAMLLFVACMLTSNRLLHSGVVVLVLVLEATEMVSAA